MHVCVIVHVCVYVCAQSCVYVCVCVHVCSWPRGRQRVWAKGVQGIDSMADEQHDVSTPAN